MSTSVDQALALRLISPLPDGPVSGLRQVARRGDVIITAELAQTIVHDTWSGIRIRLVSPSVGPLDANWFGFEQHGVFHERNRAPSARDGGGELTPYNASLMLTYDGIDPYRLRDAVAEYTAVFAPPPPPEFTAAAHLGVLHTMAWRLDHLGSTKPEMLAGRALAHGETLREAVRAIYRDLLPLTGESQAADGEVVDLAYGLASLRKVGTALTALASSPEHRDRAREFAGHAQLLEVIGAEITADLSADAGTLGGARARAALSTSAVAAAATADRSAGAVLASGTATVRAGERVRR